MTPAIEYVTTSRGSKAHRRDPNNRWRTVCGRAVDGIANAEQVRAQPHLICTRCSPQYTRVDGDRQPGYTGSVRDNEPEVSN